MKKLCCLTLYDSNGGSSQYRSYLFKDDLEKEYDIKWYCFWNKQYVSKYMKNRKRYFLRIVFQYLSSAFYRIIQLLYIAPRCDVLYIQKACIPRMKFVFLRKVKKNNVRIVFDVDDAIYLSKHDNSDKIASLSDVVVCGNDYLKSHYQSLCDNCVVLPTIDNVNNYKAYWKNTFENKIIGWIGSPSQIYNLDYLINPINQVVSRHPEVKLMIICNDDYGYTDKISNSYLTVWSKDDAIKNLSDITIGIMPLEDTDFNQGKCGFKLIQYLNMLKPVIGSDVGVNKTIIGERGFIASNESEWITAIEKLLFDETVYYNCIHNIKSGFFEEYNYDIVYRKLVDILNG